MNMDIDEKVDSKNTATSKGNKKSNNKNNNNNNSNVIRYPDFDVGKYASHYKGKSLIDRLLHMASICPDVKKAAIQRALQETEKGIDVDLYSRVSDIASKNFGGNVQVNTAWMAKQTQENETKIRWLEDEIQRWRNLSNRDRICAAYLSAAEFLMKIGQYNTAISRYIEAKSYANDQKMLIDINLKIMTASIKSGQFGHVKPESNQALNADESFKDSKFRSKVLACTGLYHLYHGRYETAVNFFLDCQFVVHNAFPEVIAGKDIALYGGLCALATFPRQTLKRRILDNGEFKRFLELTPQMSQLVQGFYESEYGKVMKGLSAMKNDLLFDMYLYPRVEHILTAIRGKALVQYFSPYSTMDINKMADAFEVTVDEMEKELSLCIGDNHIQAKIDSHSKRVYANQSNRRKMLFDSVLRMGNDFSIDLKAVLLRQSLAKNGAIVSQQELLGDIDEDGGLDDQGGGITGMIGGVGRRFGLGMGGAVGGPQQRGNGGGGRNQNRNNGRNQRSGRGRRRGGY